MRSTGKKYDNGGSFVIYDPWLFPVVITHFSIIIILIIAFIIVHLVTYIKTF